MYIFNSELRRNVRPLVLWTLGISSMLVMVILMFPEMKSEMSSATVFFENMGGISKAFGMDVLDFSKITHFYAVECSAMIGMGGAFFAATLGSGMLSKEEHERTAEFLFTHPVKRWSVVTQKYLVVVVQIIVLNVVIFSISAFAMQMVGESFLMDELVLLHVALGLTQWIIGTICFGLSAFLRGRAIGLGIGVSAMLYFLDIVRKISDSANALKYITPFSFADATVVVKELKLDMTLVFITGSMSAIIFLVGSWYYCQKDLVS